MFGVTSHDAEEADPCWENAFDGARDIPVALCRNKMDLEERPMKPDTTRYSSLENCNYYAFSAKTGKNVHMPFVWLAQKFKGDNNLMFVKEPAVQPPECIIDEETRQKLEKEIDAWA
jgi:GTP-binding nuclear protein Ran